MKVVLVSIHDNCMSSIIAALIAETWVYISCLYVLLIHTFWDLIYGLYFFTDSHTQFYICILNRNGCPLFYNLLYTYLYTRLVYIPKSEWKINSSPLSFPQSIHTANLAQTSASCPIISTNFPFPSSPHWAPNTTMTLFSEKLPEAEVLVVVVILIYYSATQDTVLLYSNRNK